MDLNTGAILVMGSMLLYAVYETWKVHPNTVPKTFITPWGEQVGRTRPIQSKTGDASLATERIRRRTIQSATSSDFYKLKETRTSTGSTTGAVETHFITDMRKR
jgi:hypothetical protein